MNDNTRIRGQRKNHVIYDDHLEMPPENISTAAHLLDNYFKTQGINQWEFMGVCSRNHAKDK